MVTTIKHHQSCIKFIAKEGLNQITKPHTLVGYRTLTDAVMKQTDAEIIGGINVSQVITFVLGIASKDSFRYLFQLVGMEEIQ